MWLATLTQNTGLNLQNIAFTITFKEEGPGIKTGSTIGRALGNTLPIPDAGATFLVLENTVTVTPKSEFCIYVSERSSYTICVSGTLAELDDVLTHLVDRIPVRDLARIPHGATRRIPSTSAPRL